MKDKNRKKGKGIKWKTVTKRRVINPNILKTTLNGNGLMTLRVERQRLSGGSKENLVHMT